MDTSTLAKLLIEGPVVERAFTSEPAVSRTSAPSSSGMDKKITVLSDRMALQIMSVPSLLAHWADAAAVENEDGSVLLQYGFLKLPQEVLPQLEKLLSVDFFKKHRLVKYIKNGQAMTGLEVEVNADDLPGERYDYAY